MAVEVKSVVFKNFWDKEFVCSWDSVPYRFPAGKEMYVEDWKAQHFAKHLVDRVMNEKGLITSNKLERDELLKLALPDSETLSQDDAFDLNAREEAAEKIADKKAKTSKKVVVEEEFEGLNTAKAKK